MLSKARCPIIQQVPAVSDVECVPPSLTHPTNTTAAAAITRKQRKKTTSGVPVCNKFQQCLVSNFILPCDRCHRPIRPLPLLLLLLPKTQKQTRTTTTIFFLHTFLFALRFERRIQVQVQYSRKQPQSNSRWAATQRLKSSVSCPLLLSASEQLQ